MKKFIYLLCIGITAGCTTTRSVSDKFYPLWQNRNFDEFIVEYGIPSSDYKLQNGSTLYKWASRTTVQKPITTNTTVRDTAQGTKDYTSYTSGGTKEMICELNILVDEQNTIKSIKIIEDTTGEWSFSRCSEVLHY